MFSPRFAVFAALILILLSLTSCTGSRDKHLSLGEQFLQQRKFHEVLMEFRIAAEIDRESPQAYWGLARAYEKLGDRKSVV